MAQQALHKTNAFVLLGKTFKKRFSERLVDKRFTMEVFSRYHQEYGKVKPEDWRSNNYSIAVKFRNRTEAVLTEFLNT